ncbi:hypothetical protein ABHQ57_14350 [Tenacibaculum sp. ZH5_bin.1]|uniref:hypothetical protein n=1 Tax=Tenacibaculum TaxID=104267 RepID=UPI00143028B7|nr:hypothetical protein [Tenacibaculum mesophilum]KAF9658718.1 hypothetical protein HBA12_00280 [Tenacibaculum mesophilum]
MAKIKKRYGKWGGYLEKLIYEKPKRKVEKEKVNDPDYYVRVDNQFFIMNNGLIGNIYIYTGLAGYFFVLFTVVVRLFFNKSLSFIFLFLLFLLGTFFIVYHYTRPKKELVLNRLEGLITIPNTLYFKPYTMPFKDALAAWSVKNSGINPTGPSLSLLHPNGFTSTDVMGHEVIEDWSFIVWYMDKNRPLPPGSAFDEYRQADFERRKAAGFPMPLYPSSIPTPEATQEQQAERKRIGGW